MHARWTLAPGLVFLFYVTSRFEDVLLQGRRVRADVPEWLKARLPKGSGLY